MKIDEEDTGNLFDEVAKNKLEALRLNLGSGTHYLKGYVNVDIRYTDMYDNVISVDTVHDLNIFPYPFKDNSATEILMDNVLEHLDKPLEVIMELERICKPGAKVKIIVPYFAYYRAYKDPTHQHYFCMEAIDVLIMNRKFKVVKSSFDMGENWFIRLLGKILTFSPIIYERFFCYLLPMQGIIWELEKE